VSGQNGVHSIHEDACSEVVPLIFCKYMWLKV
jgi:hypothetical protein